MPARQAGLGLPDALRQPAGVQPDLGLLLYTPCRHGQPPGQASHGHQPAAACDLTRVPSGYPWVPASCCSPRDLPVRAPHTRPLHDGPGPCGCDAPRLTLGHWACASYLWSGSGAATPALPSLAPCWHSCRHGPSMSPTRCCICRDCLYAAWPFMLQQCPAACCCDAHPATHSAASSRDDCSLQTCFAHTAWPPPPNV